MLKRELESSLAVSESLLLDAIEARKDAQGDLQSQYRRIDKLKSIIAPMELELATLKGYTRRIIQEDRNDIEDKHDHDKQPGRPEHDPMTGEPFPRFCPIFALPEYDNPAGVEEKDPNGYSSHSRVTVPWHKI